MKSQIIEITLDGVNYRLKLVNRLTLGFLWLEYVTDVFYADRLKTKIRRKYFFFGPKIKTKEPELAFISETDLFDPCFSKKDIRKILKRGIKYKVCKEKRESEIESGNLI